MKVLIIEDDARMAAALTEVLRLHGFEVATARTAREGSALVASDTGVVILDLGLPDRDGLTLITQLRRARDLPVIVSTARGDLASRVHGLHLGADDYLVKPYDARELMARIRAVTRRSRRPAPAAPAPDSSGGAPPVQESPRQGFTARGVTVDVERRTVTVDGRRVLLTRKEFDLLAILGRRPGLVCSREQLTSEIWQASLKQGQRTLEVHVATVRSKTGVPGLIETVRGVGYRLGVD